MRLQAQCAELQGLAKPLTRKLQGHGQSVCKLFVSYVSTEV